MSQAKVFFILESDDYDEIPYGFAFSDSNISPEAVKKISDIESWKPIEMELRDGEFADFIVNDLNIPLFSEKLKNLTEFFVSDSDHISWFPVIIKKGNEKKTYYYCKLQTYLEGCIDFDKSVIDGEMMLNPYFIKEKIKNIFRVRIDDDYLFVSEDFENAIVESKITGLSLYTWENHISNTKGEVELKSNLESLSDEFGLDEKNKDKIKVNKEQKAQSPPGTTWSLLDDED